MSNSKQVYKTILATIDTFNNTIKGKNLFDEIYFENNTKEFCKLFSFTIKLYNKESQSYYLILPSQELSLIDVTRIQNEIAEDAKELNIKSFKTIFIEIYKLQKNVKNSFIENNFIFTSPNEFHNHLFNFNTYSRIIKTEREFRNVSRDYIDRTIKYMVDYDEIGKDKNKLKKFRELTEYWVEGKGFNQILLLADRGMGKTWASRAFCIYYHEKSIENPWIYPIPIFINLGDFIKPDIKKGGIMQLLMHYLKTVYNIEFLFGDASIEVLTKMGLMVLVLDGYDDMIKEVNEESVNRQIWEIFSLIDLGKKIILTSRVNHFNSLLKIYEHFAISKYKEIKKESGSGIDRLVETGFTDIRKDFNIWRLDNMDEEEMKELYSKDNSIKISSNVSGESILRKIQSKKEKTLLEIELLKLIEIPAFYKNISKLFEEEEETQLIQIFKDSINITVIGFNIETNKGIAQYRQRQENNNNLDSFDVKDKTKILESLAWMMFEKEMEIISLKELSIFLVEYNDLRYEEILNDIKTQTVIRLRSTDDGDYSESFEFFTTGINAFFVSNYILNRLNTNGLYELGKYDLTKSSFGQTVLFMLSESIVIDNIEVFTNQIGVVYKKANPYDPNLRFLSRNINKMNLDVDLKLIQDPWELNRIEIEKDFILIPTFHKKLVPFKVSLTPVTNGEFIDFTTSNFGKYWGKESLNNNPYSELINGYHLHTWKDEESLNETLAHPVVYTGWFAAAYYCNYLSKKEGITPYYNFVIVDNLFRRVKIDNNSIGYRLLKKDEWEFVEKEGLMTDKIYHPWSKLMNKDGTHSHESEEMMNYLLGLNKDSYPVKSGRRNKYGIYWMVGNVKSWVDDGNDEKLLNDFTYIKGMTAATGIRGFEFKSSMNIPGQNTNVDVGFRVAKPLSLNEIKLIKKHL